MVSPSCFFSKTKSFVILRRLMTKMIDNSLIKLIPADEAHYEFSYQVKKASLGEYITQIWGWDEGIQRDFHMKSWGEYGLQIITYRSVPIGTIAAVEEADHIEIAQFYILPNYQNKGIGTYLLGSICSRAAQTGRVVKLRFLKINPVKSLYIRNHFCVVRTDNKFYYAERKPRADD